MENDNLINNTINDRYTLLELIGKGGMATVYKAYDSVDAREVAVKILNPVYLADEDMRNRFINEAKAIASVNHPNIVNIFDYYCDNDLAFIVMEYVAGVTLREYIRRSCPVDVRVALHFVIQILRALQHAHDAGIYHRDIKPENIMVLSNASVKVSDFGIAKLTHGRGIEIEENLTFGSVRYMSPEQIQNADVDGRTDIYSVGILLYELLTARVPFEADNDAEIVRMQLQDAPVKPSLINASVPLALEQIIIHALQKDPMKRFSSAADFLIALNEYKKNPQIVFDYVNEETAPAVTEVPEQNETSGETKPVIVPGNLVSDNDISKQEYTESRVGEEAGNQPEEYEDEDEEDDDDDQRSMTVPIIIASVVSIILIAAIIFFAIFGNAIRGSTGGSFLSKLDVFGWFSSEQVEVPNLINMEYEKAIELYPDLAFSKPQVEYNSTYEDGHICAQDPVAGTKIDKDTVIKLTVATSGDTILIQDASGMTKDEAKAMYDKDGLVVFLIPTISDKVKNDYVVRTNPTKNSFVAKGGTIFVYYASDSESAELVDVPNVVGYDSSSARAKIEAAGLMLGGVTQAKSSEAMKGLVISQSPSSSARVKMGSNVNIIVGAGGGEDETVEGTNTAAFSISLPAMSGTTGTITMKLNGRVYDTISGVSLDGSSYNLSFSGEGKDNSFEILVDGNVLYSGNIDFTTVTPSFSNVSTHQYTTKNYVPAVTGFSQADAVEKLKDAGFVRVKIQTSPSATVPAGTVISQSPDSSSKQPTATTITIVVSSGPSAATEPPTAPPASEEPGSSDVPGSTVPQEPSDEPSSEEEFF